MKNLERIDNAIRMLDADIAGLTSACHVADATTMESHLRRLETERASLIYEKMEAQAAAKQLLKEYGETEDNVDDFAAFDTNDDDFFLPEEEKRQEIIRLRDSLLDEIAITQRVMSEYVKRAHECTEILREMDGKRKGVKPNEQQAQKDITFDDGDDWDWEW